METSQKILKKDLSSFSLHILAMIFMLFDHLWATIIPGANWMTWIGRLAFPIFAFMIVEGYCYTSNFKKYLKRLFIFALLSEIPFNLITYYSWIFPFHQNVLWTFILGLLCIRLIDKVKTKMNIWISTPISLALVMFFTLLGQLLMTDYGDAGVLTVIMFYLLRGNTLIHKGLQLLGLIWINGFMIKGLVAPINLFGLSFNFPQQAMAIFSIIFIWCYKGRQGPHNKFIQFFNYAFYPVHMLILWILT